MALGRDLFLGLKVPAIAFVVQRGVRKSIAVAFATEILAPKGCLHRANGCWQMLKEAYEQISLGNISVHFLRNLSLRTAIPCCKFYDTSNPSSSDSALCSEPCLSDTQIINFQDIKALRLL